MVSPSRGGHCAWRSFRQGDAWTDPGHIVTNGAYRLTEWVHDDHILLEKNPTYYDAANVQIERVQMWMVDDATAWTMYLNGQLDTATVPGPGYLNDPVLRQEARIHPSAAPTTMASASRSHPSTTPWCVRPLLQRATDRG